MSSEPKPNGVPAGQFLTEVCSMCEEEPATTTYGAPVCQSCFEWLTALHGDLEAMEADDPDLAAKGRAIEEAAKRLFGGGNR